MTDEELKTIEGRAAKATPGPWVASPMLDMGTPDLFDIVKQSDQSWPLLVRAEASDADFVANAREDIPTLVSEVKRLRALLRPNPEGIENQPGDDDAK